MTEQITKHNINYKIQSYPVRPVPFPLRMYPSTGGLARNTGYISQTLSSVLLSKGPTRIRIPRLPKLKPKCFILLRKINRDVRAQRYEVHSICLAYPNQHNLCINNSKHGALTTSNTAPAPALRTSRILIPSQLLNTKSFFRMMYPSRKSC